MKIIIRVLLISCILFIGNCLWAQSKITYKSGMNTETVVSLAQACYFKDNHKYAQNVPELLMYLDKATIRRSKPSRPLTDLEVESGITFQKAAELGLIRFDPIDVRLTDELLGKGESTNALRVDKALASIFNEVTKRMIEDPGLPPPPPPPFSEDIKRAESQQVDDLEDFTLDELSEESRRKSIEYIGAKGNQTSNKIFRGIWIIDDPEGYLKLKIDLYSKTIRLSDDGELNYGFLEQVNEYVGDYSIISDVLSIEGDKAEVMIYSLRYGEPDDKTKLTLVFDRTNGSIKFGEFYVFPKDSACHYVEIQKPKVNVRTAPVDGIPIILAEQGQMMQLLDFDRGWYKVRLNNGIEGYVSDDFSEAVKSNAPSEAFD